MQDEIKTRRKKCKKTKKEIKTQKQDKRIGKSSKKGEKYHIAKKKTHFCRVQFIHYSIISNNFLYLLVSFIYV